MKLFFLILSLSFLALPIFAQDHILIDCIHGADYGPSWEGSVPIDFQAIFPNDILTIVTPDSLPGLTYLVDEYQTGTTFTYTIDLPEIAIPEEVQTLYVNVSDITDDYGLHGTITNPDGVLVANFYSGNGHVDGAYGPGWIVNVSTWNTNAQHIRIGYGPTIFSIPGVNGVYNLADYDAVLRLYDSVYEAFLTDNMNYSNTDHNAIAQALGNGLSFMHIFNVFEVQVLKPFIHMYVNDTMNASVDITVPGTRSLAYPIPQGDGQNFGWKNVYLQPNSQNEHAYEYVQNQRLNFIDFAVSNNDIRFTNQTDVSIYDLMLVKSTDPSHYQIGMKDKLQPGITDQIGEWKTFTTNEARSFLQDQIYNQCRKANLSEQEARHFASELPWVNILLLRAVDNPNQYFGFYRFEKDLYDRLNPVQIDPQPSTTERNMWVLVSNIQPRQTEAMFAMKDVAPVREQSVMSRDFLYREYGMIDERYAMRNSYRETGFFGIDLYDTSYYSDTLVLYDNPFANEITPLIPDLNSGFSFNRFVVDHPEQYGIFHQVYDAVHPSALAKPILQNGRVLVLGSSQQFTDSAHFPFLDAAMHSLIHSQNLVSGNEPDPLPSIDRVTMENYPNPFNPETTIKFFIPEKGEVAIDLYNVKGQLIKHLVSENLERGVHNVVWNGMNENQKSAASQVILCRMHFKGIDLTRKMVLIK